ncbi:alpha/beta hydrolase [Variovorax sp. EL159]|uniref:alpha/beta hydrolase n=1 Tax=Variovorax sp. EL159 TaxID=1566270 RepID=UPI00088F86AA|nr:alpha/beta hydrolase [Variovorax sp. EL159]SCX61267.1 alpha/beta hydrolase fold [Variovorax sp. EL159]
MTDTTLAPLPLPVGIRSRQVDNGNGLSMHVLEAGFEAPGRPCVLLLHGFPELAYSWRKVMLPLAAAGYHVVAPDQRGYGRTTGWQQGYDAGLDEFRLLNLVRDALGLLAALGHDSVAAVVGHDFGSPVAAWCALTRPDVFRSVVLMSAPFGGPPPGATAGLAESTRQLLEGLAALQPPRQHYQWYYSTREANGHMQHPPQGLHAFLRAYYHHKSADWPGNQPFRLAAMSAAELARLPSYYVMRADRTMAETVAEEMPSLEQIAACRWLPDDELATYATEYARTGFQGGLQWYRCGTGGRYAAEMQAWSGRTIDVPSCFIAGRSDWGIYQKPGDFEAMQATACTRMRGVHLVEGAGHWVQQEQPGEVRRLLLGFLREEAIRR